MPMLADMNPLPILVLGGGAGLAFSAAVVFGGLSVIRKVQARRKIAKPSDPDESTPQPE